MPLELFLDLFSQPCRSVYIFAKKNNIPFEFKMTSLMAGDQFGEEYGKVNPLRRVPALRDGEFCLGESIAIMMYMMEKFKTPNHWYPTDLQKRARVHEYLSWQHTGMRYHGTRMFWMKMLVPKIMGKDVSQATKDNVTEDLNTSLNAIEEKFLQDKPFIVGDQMSLADLVAIVEVYQLLGSDMDVFKDRPKLSAWRDRVRQEIGPELFDEAHKDVLGVPEIAKTFDGSKMQVYRRKIEKNFF